MPSTTSPCPYIRTVGAEEFLTILRDEIRALAGRGFNQPCREIELRECRLEFLLEVGAQRVAALRVLAFGAVRNPAIQFGEKLPECRYWCARSMASALVMSCFFRSLASSNSANVSRYDAGRKWHYAKILSCQNLSECNNFRQQRARPTGCG